MRDLSTKVIILHGVKYIRVATEYQEVKPQRHDARVRINELESIIEELEKENNTK